MKKFLKKVYSSIGKKKTILTSKITDEYELLLYWLVDKLNIENKMLSLIKININGYIYNGMKKEDLDEFNYMFQLNVMSHLAFIQKFLPKMKEKKDGMIIMFNLDLLN